jgi:hypothetical protein
MAQVLCLPSKQAWGPEFKPSTAKKKKFGFYFYIYKYVCLSVYFEPGPHYAANSGLKLTILSLLSAGIIEVYHHTWPLFVFFSPGCTLESPGSF